MALFRVPMMRNAIAPGRTHVLRAWAVLAVLLVALPGCGERSAPAPAAPSAAQLAFDRMEQDWRQQRRERLLLPDGWASLIGLHWLDPGAHYVGSGGSNGIRLAKGPTDLGMVTRQRDDRVRFVPAKGVALTLDGNPLAGPVYLRDDSSPLGPNILGFDEGKGQLMVIKRGDRYALRVKHADADTRLGFAGLDYWPADMAWRIRGRFIPHPPGQTIEIADIIGMLNPMPNPGAIEFTKDGKPFRLEAVDEGDGRLFLIFADRTSGHGSYGAGRFVYADPPDAHGNVVLDFNQAYNPPCAFTPFATCPLPPPGNRLDLAVTAGEKIYAKSVH